MGITAAANLVGAGAIVKVAAAGLVAVKAGQMAVRAAPRIARVARDGYDAARVLRGAVRAERSASRVFPRALNAPGLGQQLTVSPRAAEWAGRIWAGGRSSRVTSTGWEQAFRGYRAPSFKPQFGYSQANYVSPWPGAANNAWARSNYHVRVN